MGFDQDAFISYAHIDNEPLTPGQKGWVSQFHATLQAMLSQRLGENARIWRDDKLNGNDVFSDEIIGQFTKTALLVSILSPRYVRSEWCTRELREFCEAAARTGGITVGNKSRVFKVIKTPFETAVPLPEAVQQTLGYEFFSLDNGEPQELDPAFGDHARQQFLTKLSRLAWELAKSLQQLAQSGSVADANQTGSARRVVFVAECGRDQRDAREQLATELRMHGYEVLPELQLPLAEDALVSELKAQLERCALAIHLVGDSVGPVPDGPGGRSLVMLENQLAAERCRQGALRRIIWLPAGVVGERTEQQTFLDALQRDAALQYGADLLRGDIEALKCAMHLTLQQLDKPATPELAPAEGQQVVHVLMSEADRAASVPLLKLLRAQGLVVTIPVFVGDAGALREANAQLLSVCDALVLFYGAGDEVWKFHQQSELRKQGATGGAGRRRLEWTCLAPPSTADKQMLQQLEEPNLIDALVGLQAATLQSLLTALAATRTGP